MEEIWAVKNYVHANVAVFVLSYRNIIPNRGAEVYFYMIHHEMGFRFGINI